MMVRYHIFSFFLSFDIIIHLEPIIIIVFTKLKQIRKWMELLQFFSAWQWPNNQTIALKCVCGVLNDDHSPSNHRRIVDDDNRQRPRLSLSLFAVIKRNVPHLNTDLTSILLLFEPLNFSKCRWPDNGGIEENWSHTNTHYITATTIFDWPHTQNFIQTRMNHKWNF